MYAVYDEQTPANNVLLTTTRTLFDAEGRAMVTVGPYAAGETPVGTETVYDALGPVSRTNRWENAAITVDNVCKPGTNIVVGKKATGCTSNGVSFDQPAAQLLSSTATDYDVAGRVYRSYAPTQSTTETGVCTQEIGYDAAGRQVEVISLPDNAASRAVTVTHYDGPRQDWTRDARNNVTSFEYDDLGRVIRTIYPATAYKVDSGTTITNASGPVYSHVGYDGFGRKLYETPPVASAEYEHADQYKIFSYDAAGRLTMVMLPLVKDQTNQTKRPIYRYYYDAYGNQIGILDPLGRVTVMEYDSQNRLVKKYQPYQVSDPGDLCSATVFPAWDTLVDSSLSSRPHETTTYDSHGRVEERVDCEGHTTVYRYYVNDVSSPDHFMSGTPSTLLGIPGQLRIEESYEGVPGGTPNETIAYEYDRLGRKEQEVKDGTDAYVYSYDSEGRVVSLSTPQGSIGYAYDSVTGLCQSVYTPSTGSPSTKLDYGYDALGRLAGVTVDKRNNVDVNEQTLYGYNKNGSQETVHYPNGTNGNGNEAVYEYDALNRLSRLTNYKNSNHVETELLSRFEYSCFPNGQRATATETYPGWLQIGQNYAVVYRTREMAYRYDGLNRLADDKRNGNDPNSFVYDLVGNKVSQTIGNRVDKPGVDDNETTDYSYNERDQLYQEVLHKGGLNYTITYGYDANGSLTSQTQSGVTTGYGYDLRNRLISVTDNGVTTSYGYNPDGVRVRKQVGTGTPTVYLIDSANPTGYSQVLQEATGSAVTSYILGGDVIGQAVGSADPEYLLYDGHGSVRNHAKTDGTLVWYDLPNYNYSTAKPTEDYTLFSYDAWGQECRRPTGEGLYYSGEMFDPTLKMYNLRARWYNPANGRFNTIDPYVGNSYDPQSLHKYLYCHADPVNGLDPSGWETFTIVETTTITSVIQTIGMSVAATGFLMMQLYDAEQSRILHETIQEFDTFVKTAAWPFTQSQFDSLEQNLQKKARSKKRQLFLHYGFQKDKLLFGNGMNTPSWVTRDLYETGWRAKDRLALFRYGPRDAVYFILTRGKFIGPKRVEAQEDEYIPGLLLQGGGEEYKFPWGTRRGTVLGSLPIPEGLPPRLSF